MWSWGKRPFLCKLTWHGLRRSCRWKTLLKIKSNWEQRSIIRSEKRNKEHFLVSMFNLTDTGESLVVRDSTSKFNLLSNMFCGCESSLSMCYVKAHANSREELCTSKGMMWKPLRFHCGRHEGSLRAGISEKRLKRWVFESTFIHFENSVWLFSGQRLCACSFFLAAVIYHGRDPWFSPLGKAEQYCGRKDKSETQKDDPEMVTCTSKAGCVGRETEGLIECIRNTKCMQNH